MNGSWYCIEAHVKLNTPGNSDGLFDFWIDGKLEARKNNLNWIGSWHEYGINTIMFGNYWNGGSPQPQERFIDNIVISTLPVGLASSPVNPVIYKTEFQDPDINDIQAGFQCQVSMSPDTGSIVWSGEITGSANQIKINSANGIFQGILFGKSVLKSSVYYARLRQSDNSGSYSQWSPWKIFLVKGVAAGIHAPCNVSIVQF